MSSLRRGVGLFAVLGAGVAVFASLASPSPGVAQERTLANPPAVLLLERTPEGSTIELRERVPGRQDPGVRWGSLPTVPGGAVRGVLRDGHDEVFAVVQEQASNGAATYNSALYRLRRDGSATRLAGELTDASSPLLTSSGVVLVQRGADGAEPTPGADGRVQQEREDSLRIDAIDPSSGALRSVWNGRGQLAYLATALRGEEVLVYYVTSAGASLVVLDASSGASRILLRSMPALARDFSYDRAHDAVVFARAKDVGSQDYEVVSLPLSGGALRTVVQGPNEHFMPRATRDGAVLVSSVRDRGLALHRSDERLLAPWGLGSDAALGLSSDGRLAAVRHTTHGYERFGVVELSTGAQSVVVLPSEVAAEWVGFAPVGGAR